MPFRGGGKKDKKDKKKKDAKEDEGSSPRLQSPLLDRKGKNEGEVLEEELDRKENGGMDAEVNSEEDRRESIGEEQVSLPPTEPGEGDGSDSGETILSNGGEKAPKEDFEFPPHTHRFPGEETLYESKKLFSMLSLCAFANFWNWGEDILVVTSMRIFICQIRVNPLLGWLACFKPRYSSTIIRRRDVGTISFRRQIRWPVFLRIYFFLWFFTSAYILSARFFTPEDSDKPGFFDTIWPLIGIGVGFLLMMYLFFSVDWAITISHVQSGKSALSQSSVTIRAERTQDIGLLEEAIRSGYIGCGGYIFDKSKAKKKAKKAKKKNDAEDGDEEVENENLAYKPGKERTRDELAEFGRDGSPIKEDESDDDEDDDDHAPHKHLLPGEHLTYRCKSQIRVFFIIPVGNNFIAITNKRLIVRKARYPLLCIKYPWLSGYLYYSSPISSVRSIQHGRIRLFGRERFIWSLVLFHLTVIYAWWHLNYVLPYDNKYRISGLPKIPALIEQLDWKIVAAVPGVFLVLCLVFHLMRGWGLLLDFEGNSHLGIEDRRIALRGPRQMNAVEDACREGVDPTKDTSRPDSHTMLSEKLIGEASCASGKVKVTSKRLVICRNHTENKNIFMKWIAFWFRDYHVGSFDARDVVACSTRWVHLHSRPLMFSMLWLAFWCLLVGTIYRFKVCDRNLITLYCSDIPSLGAQAAGVLLTVYFLWAFFRHRSPGLVFTIDNAWSLTRHRQDFLSVRIETSAVNAVQDWLRGAQRGLGCYLPENEESQDRQAQSHTRYRYLTVLANNSVRIVGPTLPEVGDNIKLGGAPGVRWTVDSVPKGGGVNLTSTRHPTAAVDNFGTPGDELHGNTWEHDAMTPPHELDKRFEQEEHQRLFEELKKQLIVKGEVEQNLLTANEEMATLRDALKNQTLKLIEARGEIVRTQQECSEMRLENKQGTAEITELRNQLQDQSARGNMVISMPPSPLPDEYIPVDDESRSYLVETPPSDNSFFNNPLHIPYQPEPIIVESPPMSPPLSYGSRTAFSSITRL